jgi:F-type H+-transporting ATPase subunit beta
MNEGKLLQVMGPVVDVEFPERELPAIFTALQIRLPNIWVTTSSDVLPWM